jgi:hypothetical protein
MDVRRGAVARLAATAVALTLVGAGCADEDDAGAGEAVGAGSVAPEVLKTVEWGVLDHMVSVVVRNDTDRTLRRAEAVVTAVDERGTALATSTVQADRSDCCTVLDLPPDGSYGLYFDTDLDAAAIADIEVRFRDVAWGPAQAAAGPAATTEVVELQGGAPGAVVVADVTPTADAIDRATVQARLEVDGRFLAVVSGRWRCFAAGTTTRIRMQLFHAVPPGTAATDVTVLPVRPPNVTSGYVDAGAPGSCADAS